MDSAYQAPLIPRAFIWRRAHSLTGLWLVLFLIEHLFTNSQAALWIGDDGSDFIRSVNFLKNLPYLQVIEIVFLGIPFFIHGLWGVRYLMTGIGNSFSTDGSSPSLGQYPRNQAYTWQRITSWILFIGIIAHVVQMRFIEYPVSTKLANEQFYLVRISDDQGLTTLSNRLGVSIYSEQEIKVRKLGFLLRASLGEVERGLNNLTSKESSQEDIGWIEALETWNLQEGEVVAVAPSFGTAVLLMVRNTFKSPVMIFLYTGLVLAACFHGFNGLWTFLISWGVTLTARSQQLMRFFSTALMVLIAFLGLAAIWGSYWINLRN
jgi:succinate dehydrogenase / fumarate reductase cytochrome b subunit